jgi:pimeloyl-ACP methyl ester carboxylesterase
VSAAGVVPSRWSGAYRPLRTRTLAVQLAVLVAAEIVLFASYQGEEAGFHWATHFLVGLTAAALVNLVGLALRGAPLRGQLLSVLGLHLFAMFPDLLFREGVPHDEWMDVFLLHISSHYVPGGDTTWLVVALAAFGGYAFVLSRWLRARRLEAQAGLTPGVGLSGAALVRPQASPDAVALAHTRFGAAGPPDVMLLHGLTASGAFWRDLVTELEGRGVRGLVPDLLGFGRSRAIGTTFALDEHVAAVRRLLDEHAAGPVVVVGHSFGGAVAAALAAAAPEQVRQLVLISPPVFRDAAAAQQRLARRGWLARQVLRGTPVASATCNAMCLLRAPAGRLVAWRVPALPRAVALDSVEHTWPAYRDAMLALLEANPLPGAIEHPLRPTTVVISDADEQAPAADVLDHSHDEVRMVELSGDHLVPLHSASLVATLIADVVAASAPAAPLYYGSS